MPTDIEKITFSEKIINLAKLLANDKPINYFDAIIVYCERNGFEESVAATLLTSSLKEAIAREMEELNLLKNTKRGKLPL